MRERNEKKERVRKERKREEEREVSDGMCDIGAWHVCAVCVDADVAGSRAREKQSKLELLLVQRPSSIRKIPDAPHHSAMPDTQNGDHYQAGLLVEAIEVVH